MNKGEEKKNSSGVSVEGKLDLQIERRACERFPANLQARLFYGNMIYSGMITNISKNGMFLKTKVPFPVHSEFMVVILLKDRTVKLPIKVRRRVAGESNYCFNTDRGIGVELLNTPQNYLDYVGNCKSSMQFSY